LKDWFNKETSLVQAFFTLTFVFLIFDALPQDPDFPTPSYSILAYVMSAILLAFTLLCIRYIRGNDPILNTWGYVWRYLVTLISTLLLLALVSKSILRISVGAETSEISQLISLLLTPIVVWLFFCKERIKYLRNIVMYFKGV